MSLSLASIQSAKNDEELFEQLSETLKKVFPPGLAIRHVTVGTRSFLRIAKPSSLRKAIG